MIAHSLAPKMHGNYLCNFPDAPNPFCVWVDWIFLNTFLLFWVLLINTLGYEGQLFEILFFSSSETMLKLFDINSRLHMQCMYTLLLTLMSFNIIFELENDQNLEKWLCVWPYWCVPFKKEKKFWMLRSRMTYKNI